MYIRAAQIPELVSTYMYNTGQIDRQTDMWTDGQAYRQTQEFSRGTCIQAYNQVTSENQHILAFS